MLPTWLGGTLPTPKKYLFLYSDPFVIESQSGLSQEVLYEYLGDTERGDLEKIYQLLWRFAVQEDLVSAKDENTVTAAKETNKGSWIWAVNWSNFRSLVVMTDYANLIGALQARDGYPLDKVIELHYRLGILFDTRLLNTLVNRVLTAIQLIPHPVDKNEEPVEWTRIHQETPFVWIVILLQTVIRSTVNPL